MISLDKREELISLFDTYSSLLTEKQKMYFEEYYFDDFSLAEIALNHNISRNAVFDQIKKTISILEKYEANLHMLRCKEIINQALEIDDIRKIKELLSKINEE